MNNLWKLLYRNRKIQHNVQERKVDTRQAILTNQGSFFAKQTLKVLQQAEIYGAVKHWYVAPRYVGIGVRLTDATKLPKAINLANSVGYAAGVSDGSPEPPVIAMPLGFFLYYQFQLPEYVNYENEQVRMWRDVSVDDPRLLSGGLGLGPRGTVIRYDWDDAPHGLVAGMTNSGKTTLSRTILYDLMKRHTPDELRILIVDPNHDYEGFYNEEHLLAPIAHSPDDIRNTLRYFAHETQRRAENNLRNEVRYLLFIDEADKPYVLGDRENQASAQQSVREGRAFRCNVLVSTHKPDATSLGPIREELDNRYLGKVSNASTSGQLGAGMDLHKLSARGDFIHQARARSVRFQGAVTPDYLLQSLPRTEIMALPSQAPLEAAEVKRPGRPTVELDAARLAYYLYHGEVSQRDAEKRLKLKRSGHERHREFAARVSSYYKMLQENGGWFK